MIQTAKQLITKAMNEVDRADVIRDKKEIIALFIQTMEARILGALNENCILTIRRAGAIRYRRWMISC
jgi:hypothetical protein